MKPKVYIRIKQNICPVCQGNPVSVCRCFMSHSVCENGHKYHLDCHVKKELIDGRWHSVEIVEYWKVD